MKKFLLAGLFAFTLSASAFASSNNEASSKAVANLESSYADAKDVAWTVTDRYQKASFSTNNEKTEVYYDTYGNILGSSKKMAYDKLPKAALDVLGSQYTFPEYQLKDCIAFTDADNNTSYFVSLDTEDNNVVLQISNRGIVSEMTPNE